MHGQGQPVEQGKRQEVPFMTRLAPQAQRQQVTGQESCEGRVHLRDQRHLPEVIRDRKQAGRHPGRETVFDDVRDGMVKQHSGQRGEERRHQVQAIGYVSERQPGEQLPNQQIKRVAGRVDDPLCENSRGQLGAVKTIHPRCERLQIYQEGQQEDRKPGPGYSRSEPLQKATVHKVRQIQIRHSQMDW